MIPITLNGQPREVPPGSSLADLVTQVAPGPDGPLTLATRGRLGLILGDDWLFVITVASDSAFRIGGKRLVDVTKIGNEIAQCNLRDNLLSLIHCESPCVK